MADVLEQSEIDDLLNAMADGELGGMMAEDPSSSMATATVAGTDFSGDESLSEVEIRNYDFKRPERVSKDQIRALESLHENFARNFGASLSSFLRTIIDVKVSSVEQLTFAEFTYSLPTITSFSLLRADPLEGQVCLEISPLIIYPILDRMLGGGNSELFIPKRAMTQIEQRLANRVIDRGLMALTEAWDNIGPVIFDVEQTESNPQLVQIVPPNEVVVVISFEVKMDSWAGGMNLCIPFNVIEPVIGKLTSQNWFGTTRKKKQRDQKPSILENLGEAKIDVRTYLGQAKMRVNELLNMEAGDVIQLDKCVNDHLVMQIGGKSKYVGKIGQLRGFRSLRITADAAPGEKI